MKVLDAEALRLRIERLDDMASDIRIGIAAAEATLTPVPILAPVVLDAVNETVAKLRREEQNELRPTN